ncbi:helix-turn-helix domain-containing protein [Geobacter sp.]|uniref:helix-turn-helix domain-containing protein n=1 Tax=Geobacter sp. TaxID=46610 RepID=UPI00263440B4|nr:helix-turn-helix domain-containing protein [Geobacter sp.]
MFRLITSAQSLGAILRDERKKQGLTQVALGKMTGVNQTTISMIEKGKPSVQLQTVLLLFAALNLNILVGPREQGQPAEDRW